MNESQIRPTIKKRTFFLLWIGINIAGWFVWIGVATVPTIASASTVLSTIALFITCGGIGVLQWLLLKQQFSIDWYEWILPTMIGLALGLYASIWAALRDFYIVFSPPGTPVLEWDTLLGGALLGLALGCCQMIAWRPRLNRMLVWIIANVVGWSFGMFLPQWVAFLLHNGSTPWLSTLFPVAFAAVATGIALLWFFGGLHDLDKQV